MIRVNRSPTHPYCIIFVLHQAFALNGEVICFRPFRQSSSRPNTHAKYTNRRIEYRKLSVVGSSKIEEHDLLILQENVSSDLLFFSPYLILGTFDRRKPCLVPEVDKSIHGFSDGCGSSRVRDSEPAPPQIQWAVWILKVYSWRQSYVLLLQKELAQPNRVESGFALAAHEVVAEIHIDVKSTICGGNIFLDHQPF